MHTPSTDTIVAVATPAGRGGVGIVRVSGPQAQAIALAVIGKRLTPRMVQVSRFKDHLGDTIDQGVAVFFNGPHSYTGEDVLELHGHGSPLLLQALVARCIAAGAPHTRQAQPGEFTQRAFLNDKLDLAQAEAVADLIDAGTHAAARAAVRSLSGAFSAHIKTLQEKLVRLRMFTEATLDFPEEEGVEFIQAENARGQAMEVRAALERVLQQAQQGQLLHDGIRIVLVGAPNVGKSSLLNCLAGDTLAIVTPIAGTTRDTVRARLSLAGLPCEVIDTAGLRETDDPVEKIGIQRTLDAMASAHLVLIIVDASQPSETHIPTLVVSHVPENTPTLVVRNKADQLQNASLAPQSDGMLISALHGDGVSALIERIGQMVGYDTQNEGTFTARARHVQALQRAQVHIDAALGQLAFPALELFAEELRLAHRALGEIVGEFSVDDLLGEIFGSFCIGK